MKALTACLYCEKRKECGASIKAHSFLDECFSVSDEGIRAALEDLRMLTKIALPVEVYEKCEGVAFSLVEQRQKMKTLAQILIEADCERYCIHSSVLCSDDVLCDECRKPCRCRDCEDCENFELDWSKVEL